MKNKKFYVIKTRYLNKYFTSRMLNEHQKELGQFVTDNLDNAIKFYDDESAFKMFNLTIGFCNELWEIVEINENKKEIEKFIDVSHHNNVDFLRLKNKAMIFKATEGSSWVDRAFQYYLDHCKLKNIKHGFYHYYRINRTPIDQAVHFVKTCGVENIKNSYFLPVVDYEIINNGSEKDLKNNVENLKIFIKHVNKLTGRKMRIYTNDYIMGVLNLDDDFLEICAEPWIARYYGVDKKPENTGPWKKYWAHQYSDKEYIEGVGECDVNIINK